MVPTAKCLGRQPYQQGPPGTEHQDALPGVIEELGEERTQIGEQAAWHHHLLLKE